MSLALYGRSRAEFRRHRGESLIGTLLDDAPPGAQSVSVATALDLVVSGTEDPRSAGGDGHIASARRVEGFGLAAVIGLGVQAALAIGSAGLPGRARSCVLRAGRGAVRAQVSTLGASSTSPPGSPWPWPVQSPSWPRYGGSGKLAAGVSVGVSGYLVAVTIHAAVSVPAMHIRHMTFTATPGLLSIWLVSAGLAVVTAVRCRHQAHPSRTLWWLAVPAILAVTFSLVGDGNAAQGSGSNLSTAYPPPLLSLGFSPPSLPPPSPPLPPPSLPSPPPPPPPPPPLPSTP